jgi:sugar O-acyltransferase (sialic acid O-acetyltransferase NeuD family)
MQHEEIIIVGGFPEIIELCEKIGHTILGIIDDNPISTVHNVLGGDDTAGDIYMRYPNAKIVISPDMPQTRRSLVNHYRAIGFQFATVISPIANISKSSTIGEGSVIQDFVNLSADTKIGSFVKLNTMCNIMHNSIIGDFTTIAPNAVVLGHATIGEDAYIGANATILPELTIADGVVLGAGAVLTKNIDMNESVFAGIPAKEMK